ncbi:hypothetical protein [Leptospira sp. GIMC2001]|uniref:hypothetical protein n=1 Tax=Leptospira sp. GIMC2001 TaxID=1513297 RepID=UPI0023496E1E|nr:hypothetical protein [Leptospira sp. GIMC2001]WCL47612.1 hypothetical protein O4O04_01195 [Leptospira sp. GIMC2001]
MSPVLQNYIVYGIVIIVLYLLFGSTILSLWNHFSQIYKIKFGKRNANSLEDGSGKIGLANTINHAPFSLNLFQSACADCTPSKISSKLSGSSKRSIKTSDSKKKTSK